MQNCNLTLILSPYKLIITWKHSILKMCLNLLFAENHYWAAQCPTEHVWKHGSLELLPGTRRGVPLPITGWDTAKLKPQRRFFHCGHTAFTAQWCHKTLNQRMLSRERLHSVIVQKPLVLQGIFYTALESLMPAKGNEPLREGLSVSHDSCGCKCCPPHSCLSPS